MITFINEANIDLKNTMIFEDEYPNNLQMDFEEKKELLSHNSIFVLMYLDNQLIGESYGIPLKDFDEEIQGLENISKDNTIYCYSNTIIKPYQGKGYGKILKSYWLGLVKGKGFNFVYGHARPNGSQKLNEFFGAKFIKEYPNWYETGETYKLYSIVL